MIEVEERDVDLCTGEGPHSALERKYVQEYLRGKGYNLEDLASLPRVEVRQLMREACQYATLKLAEVEAKVRFRKTIHYRGS